MAGEWAALQRGAAVSSCGSSAGRGSLLSHHRQRPCAPWPDAGSHCRLGGGRGFTSTRPQARQDGRFNHTAARLHWGATRRSAATSSTGISGAVSICTSWGVILHCRVCWHVNAECMAQPHTIRPSKSSPA